MSDRISRRRFAKLAAAGAAGLTSTRLLGGPQRTQTEKEPPGLDQQLKSLEAKLAAPLSAEAKKIAREGLKGNARAAEARLKFKLPENSEPCTIFAPKGLKV